MSKFFEYPTSNVFLDIDLILSWKKQKKTEIKTLNTYELHRYKNLPKTFKSVFKVSLEAGWRKKILPPIEQKGKPSSIDVWVIIESAGSLRNERVKLTKKGNFWTGASMIHSKIFHANCSITAYVVRNKDIKSPTGNFASEEFEILGESQPFKINFIKGAAPGGSSASGRFEQFQKMQQSPFKFFDELIAVDWRANSIEILINQGVDLPNSKTQNHEVETLIRKQGIAPKKNHSKKVLMDSLALQICLVLIGAALIEMKASITSDSSISGEDMINDLDDDHKRYIKDLLEYLYPDIQNKDDRPNELKKDLETDIRQLMGVRVIQAAQSYLKSTDNFRTLSKNLIT